jgi:hypothetical protein
VAGGLLLLVAAAVLLLLDREWWWTVAAVALTLSQGLIVVYWQDAKAGTAANAILLVAVVVAAAQASFERQVDGEVALLLEGAAAGPRQTVTREQVAGLPAPVRRWLEASGVVGRERARTVRLQQRGWLRTGPEQAWMPARAQQYLS